MKNILLITTRNVLETTGEYSYINTRAKGFYKFFHVKTEVFVFQKNTSTKL